MRGAIVCRPEPGNAATAARLTALGIDTLRRPLFVVAPVDWTPPDPARFDALLLTSANAVRHAGPGLRALAALPVLAVGEATAAAARAAGLSVAATGASDAAALVRDARGFARLLHLAGRDRVEAAAETITVYRSDAVATAPTAEWEDRVALLHSVRAARRFAALVDRRDRIGVAALSPAVLAAAAGGWRAAAVAAVPTDAALTALVATMIDRDGGGVDNRGR